MKDREILTMLNEYCNKQITEFNKIKTENDSDIYVDAMCSANISAYSRIAYLIESNIEK